MAVIRTRFIMPDSPSSVMGIYSVSVKAKLPDVLCELRLGRDNLSVVDGVFRRSHSA